ncbi:hypothetical protein DFH06DRAFT_1372550 [Mycena polygramma]|nr:hypothetical protein DFH06DRAFT_1372550 [Mycena polygramma]
MSDDMLFVPGKQLSFVSPGPPRAAASFAPLRCRLQLLPSPVPSFAATARNAPPPHGLPGPRCSPASTRRTHLRPRRPLTCFHVEVVAQRRPPLQRRRLPEAWSGNGCDARRSWRTQLCTLNASRARLSGRRASGAQGLEAFFEFARVRVIVFLPLPSPLLCSSPPVPRYRQLYETKDVKADARVSVLCRPSCPFPCRFPLPFSAPLPI